MYYFKFIESYITQTIIEAEDVIKYKLHTNDWLTCILDILSVIDQSI